MSSLIACQLPNGGAERYTTRRVVFIHPFTLGKPAEVYPAGTYEVETKEEAIAYAVRKGFDYHLVPATPARLKLQAYADNFR